MSSVAMAIKIATLLEAGTSLAISAEKLIALVSSETDATREEVEQIYDWAISRSERRLAEIAADRISA